MGAFLSSLLASVLKFFAETARTWYKEEKGKAFEFEAKTRAGQLESVKTADAMEKRISEAVAKDRATTIADWNKRADAIILLFAMLNLTGCITHVIYVPSKMPTIHAPPRPILEDDGSLPSPRELILIRYAEDLEAVIDAYNEEARVNNVTHGYEYPEPPVNDKEPDDEDENEEDEAHDAGGRDGPVPDDDGPVAVTRSDAVYLRGGEEPDRVGTERQGVAAGVAIDQ